MPRHGYSKHGSLAARGFELASTVGSWMTYPSSIAGPELRISKDLGRFGDRGIPYIFQHTLQLPLDLFLYSHTSKPLVFALNLLFGSLVNLLHFDRSCRRHGFTTVRVGALQEHLATGCIATHPTKKRRTICKMSGLGA